VYLRCDLLARDTTFEGLRERVERAALLVEEEERVGIRILGEVLTSPVARKRDLGRRKSHRLGRSQRGHHHLSP
jgi:hypothetical protein